MNYLITEDELYRLEGVMRQLGFICELSDQGEKDAIQSLDLRGMLAFCSAQQDAIRQTIKAATERQHAAWALAQNNGIMGPADWMLALRIARGDNLHTPLGAEEAITRKLALACAADPDMTVVQAEWCGLLVEQSERARLHEGPATTQFGGSAPVMRASKAKSNAAARTAKHKAAPRKRQQLAKGAEA